jgi:hypothetical protein
MIGFIRRWFDRVTRYMGLTGHLIPRQRPQAQPAAIPPPPKPGAYLHPITDADAIKEGSVFTGITGPNRKERRAHDKQRRALERARLKFDKFVTPQGTPPVPRAPGKVERKLGTQASDVTMTDDGDEIVIAAKHHSDRKTLVLYEGREMFGEFNFRDTILDQLERYLVYIDRMKKYDADAYGFYRQVGATLLPYLATPDSWIPEDQDRKTKARETLSLTPWFMENRPGFGCIAYGTNPEAERQEDESVGTLGHKRGFMVPRFLYFTKYTDPPPELQPMSGGDIYQMTVWWDKETDRRLKGNGRPQGFGVFIGKDSKPIVLKMLDTKRIPIRSKRKAEWFSIPQRAWRIPHDYELWARLHGTTARVFLGNLFCDIAADVERAAWSIVRVTVEKNGRHAMFGIDISRMPYFFQDRDYQLSPAGHRKPIFHMYHPEPGKIAFRGQREFTWAGYNVTITIPGKHHPMLEEIDLGAVDAYWKKKEKTIGTTEWGRRLRGMVDTGDYRKLGGE